MQDRHVNILNVGRIFGVDERTYALVDDWSTRLDEVMAGVDRDDPLRVFVYDSSIEALLTAGDNAMLSALIKAAGAT